MSMVEFQSVSKSFGHVPVLKDIDLRIENGEVVVIVGPSGSGKSTLLRCINALEKISGGELLVDGLSVKGNASDIRSIRLEAGMVFQQFNLFPQMTALDPELRHEVLKVMQDLAMEGMTMIVVTHEIGFAKRVGTRLLFMDNGGIAEDGEPAMLIDNPPTQRLRDFLKHVT